ncbi:E3 Ubiquitin-Protein Ligase Nedd4 [Manis pentadactyla]|nr:E3 Ubiquitin-Protein Ligase Nedd4 [Manis pentadactyla]
MFPLFPKEREGAIHPLNLREERREGSLCTAFDQRTKVLLKRVHGNKSLLRFFVRVIFFKCQENKHIRGRTWFCSHESRSLFWKGRTMVNHAPAPKKDGEFGLKICYSLPMRKDKLFPVVDIYGNARCWKWFCWQIVYNLVMIEKKSHLYPLA